jgi:hypothetical protein
MQAYVRALRLQQARRSAGPATQITNVKGGIGGLAWRGDGKEMFFQTRDREVQAVDIATAPLKAGTLTLYSGYRIHWLESKVSVPMGNAL